ncbi:DUF1752-domain-containing protein [Xylaria palmicola]|nr:DUF1752-domain-containing protein [Xylaria palmicola]
MPGKAEGLVLTVDPNVIHKVDTNNPHNLFSMWTVFSRCAESVEQGRRLENLSWRLWTREALCCEDTTQTQTQGAASDITPPQDIPEKQRILDLPQLSGSVDSVADEEAIELTTESDPVEIYRPHIQRQDSCGSSRSRGRERHITSGDLEKMVVTIIKEKVPNLSPLPHIVPSLVDTDSEHLQSSSSETEETPTTLATESVECISPALTSQTSANSDPGGPHPTTVVRGFSPSQFPPARPCSVPKSLQPDVIPEPHSSPLHKPVQSKKQPAKFALGGSSGESSPSPEIRQPALPLKKNKMFQIGGSSGSTEERSPSLKSALHSAKPSSLLGAHKKQASFSNQVTMRTISTPSDQSGSYVDESAIDDDDEDSEWEDSIEESGKSSMDDTVTFKRVPSKPNLTSQRSLISLMFAGQDERSKGLSNFASQSTPAIAQRARQLQNDPSGAGSPNDSDDNGLVMKTGLRRTPLKPITEAPRSSAQPIMARPTSHYHQQTALSPRTTRRNMLATELTESLRRQLLWERQQKSSTVNAVLKRRHTSNDVANLKQYPERPYMNESKDEVNATSWNQFLREENGGYHAQGW